MRAIAGLIDAINGRIGRGVAWLTLAVVIVQLLVVIGRYVFGIGSIKVQESIMYMHAFVFMLAAAWTMNIDGHVRVDIFYREASGRWKAYVNLAGAILFVIPLSALILWFSWAYVSQSWAVLESSHEASGLPMVFVLKTVIPVFAMQVGLQGISIVVRSMLALSGDDAELTRLSHTNSAPEL